MAKVEGEFPDYESYRNKGYFKVSSDQSMNPFTWSPPINWTGIVNGKGVKFTQISHGGGNKEDYNFSNFPDEYRGMIHYIVEAIDKAMKVMD